MIINNELNSAFNELTTQIENVFAGKQGRQTAKKYLTGLLSKTERKNNWQIAETLGENTPYALQQFIYRGKYSPDKLKKHLQTYVTEKLGDPNATYVIDETGFLKKGKRSCGVKRQYSGTAGKVENCQIGVFLTYASPKSHTPIDRRLYMPKDWCDDPDRRKKAGVPKDVVFQTKPEMALEMIKQAATAGVPYSWVTGDCVYGDYDALRLWLEEQRKGYVLCVSGKEYLVMGEQKLSVSSILKGLDEGNWFVACCGEGSKGARVYDWQLLDMPVPEVVEGWKRYVLVRKSSLGGELLAYVCFAPMDVSVQKLVEVAGVRWTVECCFAESKSLVGLDHYEVQSYVGWYKHITFACLAHALLTVLSCVSLDTRTIQQHKPASCSLSVFKKKRGLHG